MPDIQSLEGIVRDYHDFELRLRQLTCNDQGISHVSIDLFTLRGGLLWWSIRKQPLEPAANGVALAKCLIREAE